MSAFQHVTLNMAGGAGYVVSFAANPVGVMVVLARAECYVKTVSTVAAPSAPTATPAPSSGAQGTYVHILANEEFTFGVDSAYVPLLGNQAVQDRMTYLQVWSIGAGDLIVNAH